MAARRSAPPPRLGPRRRSGGPAHSGESLRRAAVLTAMLGIVHVTLFLLAAGSSPACPGRGPPTPS